MAESNMSLFVAQFFGDYAVEVRIIRAASKERAIEIASAAFAERNMNAVFSSFNVIPLIAEGEEKTIFVVRYIE